MTILGYTVIGRTPDGPGWVNNWDGEIHPTSEAALEQAVKANTPGDLGSEWLAPIRVDDLEWRVAVVTDQTELDQTLLRRLADLEQP